MSEAIRTITDFMQRPASALDRATVSFAPGGARIYSIPTPEDDAREVARRSEHAAAWAKAEAERVREGEIAQRVKAFVAAGPGGGDGSTARDRLAIHLQWLAQARIEAAAAEHRRAQSAEAVCVLATARTGLEKLQAEVKAAHEGWAKFGSSAESSPDSRLRELSAFQDQIAACEPLACVAGMAAFEADLGHAIVCGLETMLPLRRGQALVEECSQPIIAKIREAAATLQAGLCELASLDEATRAPDGMELSALGVGRPEPLLSRDASLVLPGMAGNGLSKTAITADPKTVSVYRARLADETTPPPSKTLAHRVRSFVARKSS